MLRNKELVVLVLLLAILLYRGYTLMNPKEPTPLPMGGMAQNPEGGEFEAPPLPPIGPDPVPIEGLMRANPFTTRTPQKQDPSDSQETARPTLRLDRVQQWRDGSYRAYIATKPGVRPKWYKEGEPFESYRIERIDAEGESVTVYSEEHRKNFEFKVEGAR